jgi:hypothetical protein
VYGIDSQIKLKNSNVLLIGDDMIAKEIVKNLALSGVGSLLLPDVSPKQNMPASGNGHILGSHRSLVEFAISINPNIKVLL